tara:strand:- start:36 stop:500 length:465 start_codon:yes stop_codon:yes gene_type:complete
MSSTPIVIATPPPPPEGQLQDYSVDQLAGAVVLVLGAVASLLLVLWQSKCLCKVNLCYIFQCERRPPSEEEMLSLRDQAKKLKEVKDKEDKILQKEDKILKDTQALKDKNARSTDIESLIPPSGLIPPPKSPKIQINIEEDIIKDEDSKLADLT